MNTHSNRSLILLAAVVGGLFLVSTDLTPGADANPGRSPGLCTSVPAQIPLPDADTAGTSGRSNAGAAAPEARIAGLLGALGQLIVESELSHAAVSGRFEPVISTAVAGSNFALEVCRDRIVGEVSVANQPALRFVIGDFDADGNTDVAVRRSGSRFWSVDLGALRRTHVDGGAPVHLRVIEAAQPGADRAVRGQCTRLAEGLGKPPHHS